MKHWGIQGRLLALALLPLMTLTTALVAYFVSTQFRAMEHTFLERGHTMARQLAPACEYGVYAGNYAALRHLGESLLAEPDVLRVIVRNGRGETLMQVSRGDLIYPVNGRTLDFSASIYHGAVTAINPGEAGRPAQAQGTTAPRPIGSVSIELSREATLTRQYTLLRNSLIYAIAGIALATLLAMRMARGISDPVRRLTYAMQRLARGHLSTRITPAASGELRSLEEGVNAMACAMQSTHDKLEEQITQATSDLRETLEAVEIQNVELDLARKRALSASRNKSEFIADISHEIRNPLQGIIGYAQLLRDSRLDREQRDYIETLNESAQNMLNIINTLLDLSKLEAGKLVMDRIGFDLTACVEGVIGQCAPLAYQKQIELVSLVYADVPRGLRGDPLRVRQILLNLVGNAVKYTNEGHVILRVMQEEESANAVLLKCTIADTGPGISLEDQARLFTAFSQAETPLPRTLGGSGLGLAICRKLITQMGGEIGVDTQPGKGSTFWFTVPFDKDPEATTDLSLPSLAGHRILLYDRHRPALQARGHLLTTWGLDCVNVSTAEGLEKRLAQGDHYDLVILALDHHEVSGDASASLIGVLRARSQAPVLTLANSLNVELHARLHQLGARISLPKHTHIKRLYREITALIPGTQQLAGPRCTPQSLTPLLAARRVLVADDDPINRKYLVTLLQRHGASTDQAQNGIEVLRLVDQRHYDLILLDMRMPEMTGREAALRLRDRRDGTERTPVIAVTANAQPMERAALSEAGVDLCLIKPVTEQYLLESICRLLSCESDPATAMQCAAVSGMAASVDAQSERSQRLTDDLFNLLIQELPQLREQISHAYQQAHHEALREAVHKLHGAASCFQAGELRVRAAHLEGALVVALDNDHAGQKIEIDALWQALDHQIARTLDQARV
jgi:two-component system sensor histidine kinase BarA